MKFHKLCEMFPGLPEKDFNALIQDIKENGLKEPIVKDKEDRIIDGRQRFKACLAAQVEPRFRVVDFTSEAAIAIFIRSANIHRRHLSQSGKARFIAKLAVSDSSPVKIVNVSPLAKQLKVSESAVSEALKVLKSGDKKLIEQMENEEITIKEAYRKAKAKESTKKQIEELTPLEIGKAETEPLKAIHARLLEIKREVEELLREPQYAFVLAQGVDAGLENALRNIAAGFPHALCPYCGGDKCKACKQQGWMPKMQYDAAPRELKRP